MLVGSKVIDPIIFGVARVQISTFCLEFISFFKTIIWLLFSSLS